MRLQRVMLSKHIFVRKFTCRECIVISIKKWADWHWFFYYDLFISNYRFNGEKFIIGDSLRLLTLFILLNMRHLKIIYLLSYHFNSLFLLGGDTSQFRPSCTYLWYWLIVFILSNKNRIIYSKIRNILSKARMLNSYLHWAILHMCLKYAWLVLSSFLFSNTKMWFCWFLWFLLNSNWWSSIISLV